MALEAVTRSSKVFETMMAAHINMKAVKHRPRVNHAMYLQISYNKEPVSYLASSSVGA